jgi:hypothetical protein
MATLQELLVKIGADTDGLDKIDQGLGKVRDAGEKVTGIGKSLTAGVTTPIVGLGAAVVKTAADFESGMNGVRAVTGATGDDFEALQGKAREMGATTAYSATESANAMEFLGMAGWDTVEILDGLALLLDPREVLEVVDALALPVVEFREVADAGAVEMTFQRDGGEEGRRAVRDPREFGRGRVRPDRHPEWLGTVTRWALSPYEVPDSVKHCLKPLLGHSPAPGFVVGVPRGP